MKTTKFKIKPIIISGPTACGKSALALQLAQKTGSVIINADSQQVYKEIPILSAQPSREEQNLVPHYLYGEISGDEEFNVAIWLEKVKSEIINHKSAIITGGTGMYLHALINGLSPIPEIPLEIREKTRAMSRQELSASLGDKADGNTNRMRRNLEVKLATGRYIDEFHQRGRASGEDFMILNMNVSRETVYDNINRRFAEMVENGAIAEVEKLLEYNYPPNLPVMKAVGVAEIKSYLDKEISLEETIAKAQQRSRNYAKRQMTWFRNQMPHTKIDVASLDEAINLIS